MSKIGIAYNSRTRASKDMAQALREKLTSLSHECWVCPAQREAEAQEMASGTEVIISVGGDGTILRVARIAVPLGIPMLGVNMGRVGFMTEVDVSEAMEKVPEYLVSESRVEERTMLDVEVISSGSGGGTANFRALNDFVVARGASPRVCHIETFINGSLLTGYQADGAIVATATGSTSYALASGGPVMHPESKDLLLVPISPHLSFSSPLVIDSQSVVELRFLSQEPGVVSVDGQIDRPVRIGDVVRARRSDMVARFLRAAPPSAFYKTLTQRLRRTAPE